MRNYQAAFDWLDRYIEKRMQVSSTPGMALALYDRDKSIRIFTYGFSDLETQTPVSLDTLFGIGSITKSFTAVAVIQAAERGQLDLDAKVTDYLPWFRVQSKFPPITIRDLLAHSGGIVGIIDRSPDVRGATWALRETETAWPPGAHFYYSDAGYQVLGLVLEEATGKPFSDIIRANLFDPLEMKASEPAFIHAIRLRTAKGYCHLYDDRPDSSSHPLVPAAWIEMNAGDCCIASTAGDMAKFGRMLLNSGHGPHGPLLSAANYDLLTHSRMITPYGFSYGYGLEIFQEDGLMHIGHGGGMPGYEAFLLMDTRNGLGVALLSTTPSIRIRDLAWKVMNLWRKAYLGESLGSVDLALPDPKQVENAADFARIYRNHDKSLSISAEGGQLVLHYQDKRVALEKRGNDSFYVPHPDFDRFLLRFERAETASGTPGDVIAACHGKNWYVSDQYTGQQEFDYPPEWNAYPGHYRAHIPWQTNFRVILRKGTLWFVLPDGSEDPLTQLEASVFRIGDEISPERLRFSQVIKGQAQCANYSGSDYYRFFTP